MASESDNPFQVSSLDAEAREKLTESAFEGGSTTVPPVELLDEDENARFVLQGKATKDFAVGSKKSFEGTATSRRTILVATDGRFVILNPKGDHDVVYSIPYGAIEDVEVSSGWTKKRLTVRTAGSDYHLYTRKHEGAEDWEEQIPSLVEAAEGGSTDVQVYERYFTEDRVPELFDSDDARRVLSSPEYRPEVEDGHVAWKPYSECPNCSEYSYTLCVQDRFSEGRPESVVRGWRDGEAAMLFCEECEYEDVLIG